MHAVIRNLLFSGLDLLPSDSRYRPLFLINLTSMSFALLALWFTIFDIFYLHNFRLAISNGATAFVASSIFFTMRKHPHVYHGSTAVLCTLAVMTITLSQITHNKNYILLWTLFFPLLAFYFKGLRYGTSLSLLYLTLLIIIDFIRVDGSLSLQALLNLFFSHVGVILTAFYFEMSREESEQRLHEELAKSNERGRILREISIIDDLTQLYNRNYFNEVFDKELQRARRADRLVAFFILDVDYFKQYNDHYGHFKGDLALQSVGALLNWKLKRADDTAFRLGGEEFGGIIHGHTNEDIFEFAQAICDGIEKLQIPHSESKVSSYLTASIGITVVTPDRADNPDEVYRIADQALYAAKQNGRNRVVSAP